ncbi:MAG: SLBB domain-containing protein [Desulfosudaceae bacterium]
MIIKSVSVKWMIVCLVCCCLLSGQLPAAAADSQNYQLGEGDVLTITVYEQPDLKTTVRVSGNGMVSLPLLGQVSVNNLSVKELEEKIEGLLADGYIVNPQVNIFIDDFRSRKVTILGEVKKPGVYEIQGRTTLLELISQADGLNRDATDTAVIQHRSAPETEPPVRIDLSRLMEEGQAAGNIEVRDGDHVYIPKKEVFYVSGQVKNPDVYNYEKGLTVIKALTMAGGPNDKAAPSRTRIIRTRDGQEHLIKDVSMDKVVRPNDVIVVPESYF